MSIEEKQGKWYYRAGDEDVFELNQPFAKNGRQTDLLRLMMYTFWQRPIPPDLEALAREVGRPVTGINEDAIDELRDHQEFLEQQIEAMQQAISVLQQSGEHGAAIELINRNVEEIYHAVSQLARKLDQLSARVDTMQVIGAVEVDTPPPTTREERLSSKLKSIRFGALH